MKLEDNLQAECYQYFHNTFPKLRKLLWAVPNGGLRKESEARRLKATGVVPGVHDLHLFYGNQFYTFELKVGNNSLSEDQKEFWTKIESQGGICYEIRDFETFKSIIHKIVKPCN